MRVRAFFRGRGLVLAVSFVALSTLGRADDQGGGKRAIRQDRVVAGGLKDFQEVRHLVLAGTNEAIGEALATLARDRYQIKPEASPDPFRTRVQRRYLEKNYPILAERMRGVAAAFGKRPDDDTWDFSGLSYLVSPPGGCSVVYFPPGMTADGRGVVSRNYDFSTGTLRGAQPGRGELAATARPYVIEMHPDRGYASLAICSYDLLSGVLDGINSEGLTVTLLADDEITSKFPHEPAEGGVGLGSLQVPRMLLDTCATVEEAKEALLLNKQFYEFIQVHYLIADRHGKAFVWEYSPTRNREYILENPGKPLITTNFSLHRHLEGKSLPSAKHAKDICGRYCALAERIAAAPGKVTVEAIKETHKAADITAPPAVFGGRPPIRTLWHALYVPERRAVQVSFYLRDEADPAQKDKVRIVRSEYLEFVLKNVASTKE
jgi:hypothetical protein